MNKLLVYIFCLFLSLQVTGQETREDSTDKSKFKITDVLTTGNVSLGYEYGFLPFLVTVNPPQGNLKTQGNLGLQLMDLPFNARFYYSSLGTISGLNNHFTVNFDANKYLRDKKEKLLKDKLSRLGEIDSLNLAKQQLKTKLDYLYLLKDGKITLPKSNVSTPGLPVNPLDTLSTPSIPTFDNPLDTISTPNLTNPLDTLSNPTIPATPPVPDIPTIPNSDSIQNLITGYQNQVETIENTIEGYQNLNEMNLDSLARNGATNQAQGWKGKVSNVFSGVKKLEIGMTYPSHSEFLVSRIPIRGVNTEYQYKKLFVAFTHGKTVNNIFFTNNVIQNNLNAGRNLYNFFDFRNIDDGRKVTAFKVGYGEKKGSHLFVGALKGLGKVSYQDTSDLYESENNLVGELDLKLKIKKSHTVDVLYGRSAVQINSVNLNEQSSLFDQLIDFNERTQAVLTRYTLQLKTTEVKATFRLIDPFFRSFGVGFIRSDNIRYDLKLKQKLGKKVTLGGYYRRENDNIIGIYNYQNVILSYGGNVMLRPNKHWMFKADIRPIVQNVNNEVDSLSFKNENYIFNLISTYNNRIEETYFFATAVYSHYQLSFDEGINTYQNLNLNLSIQHKDKFNNDLIFNRYITSDTSTVPLASILEENFTFKRSKIEVTGILKASFQQNNTINYGYGAKLGYKISSLISIEASFEKLVFGDFYNSIFQNNLSEFPYYGSLGINISW